MAGIGGSLDGGRELAEVEQKQPLLGRLIRRVIDSVNTTAQNAAVSPTGEIQAPPPISSINVSVAPNAELMHVTLNHPGNIQRNLHYIVEVHTSPDFANPVIIHDAGSSRTLPVFQLPTKSADGTGTHSYYVRAYAQNPASQPSVITVAGGASSPTAFQMHGASQMDFSRPQGSGTGPNSGQGGQGLGKTLRRG